VTARNVLYHMATCVFESRQFSGYSGGNIIGKGESEGRLPADWLAERASECVCVVATHKENFPLGYTGKLKSYSPNEYIYTHYTQRGPAGRLAENNAACALNNMQGGEQKSYYYFRLLLFIPIATMANLFQPFCSTAISTNSLEIPDISA
jgi:hypothetical protein